MQCAAEAEQQGWRLDVDLADKCVSELTAQQEAAIYSKFSPRPTIKRAAPVKRDLPEYLITISFFTFSLSMLALLASPIIALFL